MKKHGNVKYKFADLKEVGDTITEKPNNVYSLKAAFRNYNTKRESENLPKLKVRFNEYGGKRVDIVLESFLPL